MAGGIEAAWRTDLLEESDGEPLTVAEGTALVPMLPFGTVTLRVRLAEAPATGSIARTSASAGAGSANEPGGGTAAGAGGMAEPAQPVFTRYWLHGKGPAPAGNMPVAVHFSPTRVTLGDVAPDTNRASGAHGEISGAEAGSGAQAVSDGTRVTLTVACGPAGARGTVELVVPDGLAISVTGPVAGPSEPLPYDLEPNGFASWDVAVSALPGTAGGRYFLTARITDELGQVLEDAVLVTIGEAGGPDPDLPPEELFFRLQSDVAALAGEADIEVLTPAVRLAPGARGSLEVRVASHLASQLRGEAQLISPVGTWQATGPWTQPVTLPAGGSAVVRFDVTVPATAEPGWESWLLVKLMYFGRVRYSEAVPLTVI
jgi:hypothetical protein